MTSRLGLREVKMYDGIWLVSHIPLAVPAFASWRISRSLLDVAINKSSENLRINFIIARSSYGLSVMGKNKKH